MITDFTRVNSPSPTNIPSIAAARLVKRAILNHNAHQHQAGMLVLGNGIDPAIEHILDAMLSAIRSQVTGSAWAPTPNQCDDQWVRCQPSGTTHHY